MVVRYPPHWLSRKAPPGARLPLSGVQRAGQSPAEIEADCSARSQDYLVQMLRNAALTLMMLIGVRLLILNCFLANATAFLDH